MVMRTTAASSSPNSTGANDSTAKVISGGISFDTADNVADTVAKRAAEAVGGDCAMPSVKIPFHVSITDTVVWSCVDVVRKRTSVGRGGSAESIRGVNGERSRCRNRSLR